MRCAISKTSIAICADGRTFKKYIVELQSQKSNLYLRTPYTHFVLNDTITEKLFLFIVGKLTADSHRVRGTAVHHVLCRKLTLYRINSILVTIIILYRVIPPCTFTPFFPLIMNSFEFCFLEFLNT